MNRVVFVSNRVADPNKSTHAGGVTVAISDYLNEHAGLWFGWSGNIDNERSFEVNRHLSVATLPLTESEYLNYYLGYSNSVLWPVFHNRVDLARFEEGYFDAYAAVNRRFASALVSLLTPGDIIWVHDYHFITIAQELRALGVSNKIGFFLHIPFPPSQSFMAVPEYLQLAQDFAAYDLIGLQATSDVANMIDFLLHGAGAHMLPDGRMKIGHRECSIVSAPVGIDPSYFKPSLSLNTIKNYVDSGHIARIIGVDRLDYTKGLPQKFRAFDHFLSAHPEYCNRAILTQIAAPTRESVEAYNDIRKELESLAGAINGRYGDLEWVPIHYINRTTARERLVDVYRSSAVGLVTPLRDGMNLVAKEYVAAQDPANPGVLILSRFAGAAEQLSDALIVNPYNVEEVSASIYSAIKMSLPERQQRHASLMKNIETHTAANWAQNFLTALATTGAQAENGSERTGKNRRRAPAPKAKAPSSSSTRGLAATSQLNRTW